MQQPPLETPTRARFPRRRTAVQIISVTIIVIAAITILTAGYVYYQAVKTFEVRRVSLPTRVYTDLFPLQPGIALDADDLIEKAERLGYRNSRPLTQAGEYFVAGSQIDLHLRPFRHPAGDHERRRVRVVIEDGRISSVVDLDHHDAVEEAALEPELLTSILNDQLENRSPVTLDQIPPHLVDAVIVTEDARFWQHPGVDPIGIFRAFFRNIRAKGVAEGGSTLTQQLVKNYYLTNERTMRRKAVEAFMSVMLDAKYSKREILEAYLNDIYLGRNRSVSILGVGQASRFYFGKPVGEISIPEAALLAGMIRSPNNYSPFTDAEKAKSRRDTVLRLMLNRKKITQTQYDRAMASALPKKPYRERSGLGSMPFYVDRVVEELRRDYGIEDVEGRGLAIYTAIDLEWQALASRTLSTGLAGLEKSSRRLRRSENPLEGAMIAVDVPTGEIRALVGGRNYERSQFNRITRAKRQVGSLFKPFVYLAAFEPSLSRQNITPATLVNDSRFVLERRYSKDWSPRNYEGHYMGIVTVRKALEHSLNAASVRLGLSTGLDAIIKAAHALGVETELDDVPSLILGSVEISPMEMAEAYTTIARVGSRTSLHAIRHVVSENGRAYESPDFEPVQVFPARSAYLGVHVMQGVVDRGTAARARAMGFRKRAAGKTGTTNEKRDAWFIGFTPQTLALTWVGFDDNKPVGISGSDAAVPIWTRFMRAATRDQRDQRFQVPAGIIFAAVDSSTGGRAIPECPRNEVVTEAFKYGTEPSFICPKHSAPVITPMPEMMPGYDPTATTTDFQTGTTFPTDTSGDDPILGGGNFPPTPPPVDPLPPPISSPQAPLPEQPQPEPEPPDDDPDERQR